MRLTDTLRSEKPFFQQTSLGSLPQIGLVGKALDNHTLPASKKMAHENVLVEKLQEECREIIPYTSSQEKVNKFSQIVKNHFN